MSHIFLLAPSANLFFGGAPSGSTYVSNQYGIVVITNNSAADEAALIAAGCAALVPVAQNLVTVASLPPASPPGQRAFVSDSTLAGAGNFGASVTGGGTHAVPVYTDESATWRVG
jgi:hypothetical protein